jgi:hypothetical protein
MTTESGRKYNLVVFEKNMIISCGAEDYFLPHDEEFYLFFLSFCSDKKDCEARFETLLNKHPHIKNQENISASPQNYFIFINKYIENKKIEDCKIIIAVLKKAFYKTELFSDIGYYYQSIKYLLDLLSMISSNSIIVLQMLGFAVGNYVATQTGYQSLVPSTVVKIRKKKNQESKSNADTLLDNNAVEEEIPAPTSEDRANIPPSVHAKKNPQ